jgi:hypothetical protein
MAPRALGFAVKIENRSSIVAISIIRIVWPPIEQGRLPQVELDVGVVEMVRGY